MRGSWETHLLAPKQPIELKLWNSTLVTRADAEWVGEEDDRTTGTAIMIFVARC